MTALACAVCLLGSAKARAAYMLTAMFLSAVPLTFVGCSAWWLWRNYRGEDSRRS